MPLDQILGQMKDVFYARLMDDWICLTKSKTALRKVVKKTHHILETLKLKLHPMKTYIGKISHGFNFLGYYFDDKKILPSTETIRRFHERTAVFYERPFENLPRRYHNTDRDISLYYVNEAPPSNDMLQDILEPLLEGDIVLTHDEQKIFKRIRQQYVDKWMRWLWYGLSTVDEYLSDIKNHLPYLFSCWDVVPALPSGLQ